MTFTEKAAGELKLRLREGLEPEGPAEGDGAGGHRATKSSARSPATSRRRMSAPFTVSALTFFASVP